MSTFENTKQSSTNWCKGKGGVDLLILILEVFQPNFGLVVILKRAISIEIMDRTNTWHRKILDKDKRVVQTHILPVLLQQRSKEANTELHNLEDLLFNYSIVSHNNTHAKNLFKLKLHHSLNFIYFWFQGLMMCHQSRELPCIRHCGWN